MRLLVQCSVFVVNSPSQAVGRCGKLRAEAAAGHCSSVLRVPSTSAIRPGVGEVPYARPEGLDL